MIILIYHHDDNDGYLAASIAYNTLKQNTFNRFVFRVGHYDGDDDLEAVEEADLIYVLDYRLPVETMRKHFDKIIWIDHHKTAIDEMKKIEDQKGKEFAGLRKIGESGSLLTWKFFNNTDVPLVVQLVNDRDVWEWKLGEKTAAFHEVSRMFMTNYNVWETMLTNNGLVDKKLQYGFLILEFIKNLVDIYNNSFSWEGWFEGHPVVFLNGSGVISGELHKRLREQHPGAKFAVTFMFRQDKVTIGMYIKDGVKNIDLGSIAKKYGGGGHQGAAGFFTTHEEWIRIIKESQYASVGYKRGNP